MCCLDRLLGELGARTCSHGSRVMMLLLIESNNSVCVEALKMVRKERVCGEGGTVEGGGTAILGKR